MKLSDKKIIFMCLNVFLLPSCGENAVLKCAQNVTDIRIEQLNYEFISLGFQIPVYCDCIFCYIDEAGYNMESISDTYYCKLSYYWIISDTERAVGQDYFLYQPSNEYVAETDEIYFLIASQEIRMKWSTGFTGGFTL